jgi:hypothetical protein
MGVEKMSKKVQPKEKGPGWPSTLLTKNAVHRWGSSLPDPSEEVPVSQVDPVSGDPDNFCASCGNSVNLVDVETGDFSIGRVNFCSLACQHVHFSNGRLIEVPENLLCLIVWALESAGDCTCVGRGNPKELAEKGKSFIRYNMGHYGNFKAEYEKILNLAIYGW